MTTKPRRAIAYATRAVTAVAIVVLALLIYATLIRTAPKVKTTDANHPVRRVTVFEVKPLPIGRQWRGYGTSEAMDSADVPARVTTTVEQIGRGVLAGLPVRKGQLLVQLDAHDFQRQVEIAEQEVADLDVQTEQIKIERTRLTEQLRLEERDVKLARQKLDRLQELADRGASNPGELDATERVVIAAERTRLITSEARELIEPRLSRRSGQRRALASKLKLARQDLKRCSITSPIDGVLQSVDVEIGENISAGERVARVVDLRKVEVALNLPSAARTSIAVGNTISIAATNQSGLSWTVRVSRIAPEDDVTTRTMSIYVEVDQTEVISQSGWTDHSELLMPGMFVRGVATSGKVQQRWVVPRRSVSEGRVWVVDNGVVRSQPVRVDFLVEGRQPGTAMPDTQWAVLDDSLHEGDLILADASISVLDGQEVAAVLPTGELRQAEAQPPSKEAVR